MKSRFSAFSAFALGLGLSLVAGNSGCMLKTPTNTNPLASVPSEQPDKVLYDRAMSDVDHGKYAVARLTLETLINAYPDSEYLARAKMGIADAWYREGGTDGLAQAEAQYKDFITFFPTMNEASEAQLKVATIHFRQLQKADRDPSEAEDAQTELRTFLAMYPESPLRNQALQMLRDVQEILADREDRIGRFYLDRGALRAAQSRLQDVVAHYPLYSRGDAVTSTLASSYELTASRYEAGAALEQAEIKKTAAIMTDPRAGTVLQASAKLVHDTTAHSRDLMLQDASRDRAQAVADYQRLIVRYPASPWAQNAKKRLQALHAPVPTPTADAIAFNKAEIAGRGTYSRFDTLTGMLRSQPKQELALADKVGIPSLAASQQNEDTAAFGGAQATLVADNADTPVGSPGGVIAPTATPNATYNSNFGDVSAATNGSGDSPLSAKDDTEVLTPSEIDAREQEAIIEENLENNPPAVNAKAAAAAAAPDPNVKPKKKSFFSHILPIG